MSHVDVVEPVLPRHKMRLKRYESGSEEYSPPTIKDHFQRQYFEILDCTIDCIKSRFDPPGYNQYSKVESLLLKTMNGDKFEEEYDFVMMMLATFFSKYSYKHWQLKYLEKNPSLIFVTIYETIKPFTIFNVLGNSYPA